MNKCTSLYVAHVLGLRKAKQKKVLRCNYLQFKKKKLEKEESPKGILIEHCC